MTPTVGTARQRAPARRLIGGAGQSAPVALRTAGRFANEIIAPPRRHHHRTIHERLKESVDVTIVWFLRHFHTARLTGSPGFQLKHPIDGLQSKTYKQNRRSRTMRVPDTLLHALIFIIPSMTILTHHTMVKTKEKIEQKTKSTHVYRHRV